MRIRRLRLSGFKSFVDAAELRIEPGLTGVVGPNGCGKSNLLEALRWTMGENSPKSMRGAGMEDVIFAGTTTRPAREFAEVSILAEDQGGDDLEIVRRIERGAGSAYRINGRDVRAKDVALLFADAATGAHSPALVSQGRIGAVIAAKPADRRAMLEEAAGIAGLHVRRRDAEQKLRATEANLTRLGEVIADQESRANALRRQARQAERYRQLSDRIRTAEARMIYARWRDAAAAADAAKREAAAAEALVAERAEAQRAGAADHARATEALATARADALAARDAAGAAARAFDAAEAELGAVRRRIAEVAATRDRLDGDRAREGDLASDAAAALARLADEARATERRIAEATARIPAADQALAEAERGARDAEVALAQAHADQARELADLRVADAALVAARQRLDRAVRDVARIEAEQRALGEAAPMAAARDAATADRRRAERQIETARTGLARAEASERAARDGVERAQSARASAHAELAALDSEAAALGKAIRSTTRDRLLDRIAARPGYERALAAALGDDLEAGLDPAGERHWAGAEPLPADPAAPVGTTPLAQLVDAPAALARRLRQVFVAEQDDGAPLAVGQRLVTLGGALRRWDGYVARSGGAAAAERLERVNRLAALDTARAPLVRAVEAADAALAAIGDDLAEARRAGGEARRLIEASEQQRRDAARAEDRAAAALERLDAQRADLAQRASRTRADRDEAAGEVERAEAVRAALPDGADTRARVAALASEAEARHAAVGSARAARMGIEQALVADRERQGTAAGDARAWKARAGDAAKRIADIDRRAVALGEEAATLAARPDALETQISTLRETAAAARAAAEAGQAAERGAEAALRAQEALAARAAEALAEAREARAGVLARAENQELRRVEMGRLSGERFECPPPVLPERLDFASASVGDPASESSAHERLLAERERIGPVNLVADTELAELETRAADSSRERAELETAVNRLRGSIGTLNREGRARLLAAFEAVDGHFRRLFTTLFGGGEAHLALIDSDDPLEAGLEIMAQPPGKKLQSLTLLSGGEQALTAIALIFGLFLTNPAPICVLDEVDAPLDDANIDRFCDLLDAMTRETDTRYLIVTHNAATMARMHRLFGVTMVERGVSRLVSVDLGGAEALLAAE